MFDNSLVICERGQNIVENRRGGRSAPTTVNSSVRPREYLTTAEIELHVHRAKNGSPSVHPMQGDEIRALRRLQREQGPSSHVFMTERAIRF